MKKRLVQGFWRSMGVSTSASLFLLATATCSAGPVCLHHREECGLIAKWWGSGTAAGNLDDFYDNRDRNHSRLNLRHFPQLTEVKYSQQERDRRLDWAAQIRILPHTVIGNSSTASGVMQGGSNVRQVYYTSQRGMDFLYRQYRSNNLYVYPEHRDHDVGHNGSPGYGDLLATNSPYVLLSQGSSGSDRPFLEAFAHTLAAFRPEVKSWLRSSGLLMPTLQQIFRRSQKGCDYFTGDAHPTVFNSSKLDAVKMVKLAHELSLQTIPPLVQIEVLEEEGAEASLFPVGSERLCDTPCVISRIHRRSQESMQMVVSAKRSYGLGGDPLSYKWVVLRGDPERISIVERERGVAEIEVKYHERRPIKPGAELESNRVDIGVFVKQGKLWSAPAFVTIYTLDNELRTYEGGELEEIHFEAATPDFALKEWDAVEAKLSELDFFAEEEREEVAALLVERRELIEAERIAKEEQAEARRAAKDEPDNQELKKAVWAANKKFNAHKGKAEALVDLPRESLGGESLHGRIRRVVQEKIDDLTFWEQQREEEAFSNYMEALEEEAEEPLYNHKRYLMKRFNLAIVVQKLYPGILEARDRLNYVDQRLTTPKRKLLRRSDLVHRKESDQKSVVKSSY